MFPRERGEKEKDRNPGGRSATAEVWRLPVSLAFQVVLSRPAGAVVFPVALDQPQMSAPKSGQQFALHFGRGRVSVRLSQIGSELKIFHCAGT